MVRGVWAAVDIFTQLRLNTVLAVVLVSYIGLASTRTNRNLIFTPFVIVVDYNEDYFSTNTVYQSLQHVSYLDPKLSLM